MFGSKSCVYCQVFNRNVAPGYRRSKIGHRAPLKEIDIDRHGTGGYALRGGGDHGHSNLCNVQARSRSGAHQRLSRQKEFLSHGPTDFA